jgi:putative ABC transport system ATP-binding protein
VLTVFDRLNQAGRTIVMITHEDNVAAHAGRIVRVSDGRIVEDSAARHYRSPDRGCPPPTAGRTTGALT